ncbi:MAG: efflux RND transporter periplasmic adaptor subunit [Filimonas sp.]|nr:efflux RND transporter periplasmic adaptor subunit [Filimonas sp.]
MRSQFYLIAVALLLLQACTNGKSSENKDKLVQEFPVVQLSLQDTQLHKTYVTSIAAKQNVEIRAKVSGFLEKIFVDEGKEVSKGQLLFQLNDKEYQIELAKARASLASAMAEANAAELELERVKLLVSKNVIAKTEQQLAQAKVKAAQARISEAKATEQDVETRLSYTFIRAPFSGIIDRLPLKLGSLVEQGTLLTTISDLSAVYGYFNVSEIEYLHFTGKKGKDSSNQFSNIQLTLADGTPYPHKGKIETVEGEFDQNTGSIAFRATFPNPKKLLKHGATGSIQLTTPKSNSILVPQKAVFEIQDKNYVFVVDDKNIARMKNFEPEARVGNYYLVKEGLSEKDKIVYEGIQSIRDGEAIKPKMTEAK